MPGGVTCRIMSSFHPCWVLKADSAEVSQPEVPQLEPESSLKVDYLVRSGWSCDVVFDPDGGLPGGLRCEELKLTRDVWTFWFSFWFCQ